jgi:hypothetical protein
MTEKEENVSHLAQGTNIQGPTTTTTRALARREPIPRELAALGVTVAVDPESDMQILVIPKALREKANVLTPVQAFQQADPNWRPSLRVVELDPDPRNGPHFYPQAGQKLAPRKQALELLADAAGVVSVRTMLTGRERVVVGDVTAETFTHAAVLKIRKSDGTLRTLEASRTYEPFAEYEEIVTAVGSGTYAKTPGTAEHAAEVRKRWLNEIKFAKAKNESKAILRAIRSALQIPHTFTAQAAAKPFVVVGWNLAPQDSAAVQSAIAELYGASASDEAIQVHQDWSGHELGPTSPEEAEVEPVQASETPSVPDGAREPVDDTGPDGQGPVAEREDAPAPPLSEPTIPGLLDPESKPEPEVVGAVDEEALTEAELAEVTAFGKTKPPFGTFQTKSTVAAIFAVGEQADEWIAYTLRNFPPQHTEFHRLLVLACRVHRPELYKEWKEEA